jgi:D-tagatose-1,6-bisphosphate aldolase subunit GatZ/KbaZ
MPHPLDEIVKAQKRGENAGITSICSSHPWVLKAALRMKEPVLVESTCNQVNQFGGYTGMTPADFVHFVHELANLNGFPLDQLILGGDHLGPNPWQSEPAASAMQKSAEMIRSYVKAGYKKIHLDASMKLGDDDPEHPLDLELVAQRTALLAKAAEAVADPIMPPCYVVGSEVPTPGGVLDEEQGIQITSVISAQQVLDATREAFLHADLEDAWERVVAVVVQSGVEFGDDFVLDYQPKRTRELARYIEGTRFVFEAHSTDYQTRVRLREMVRDHFAILKVGPALTYAFREAVYALAMIENELIPTGGCSNLIEVLEEAMLLHPEFWQKHYHGDRDAQCLARKFSLSDRIRYYWTNPQVQVAFERLLHNLGHGPIPLSLISQFAPQQLEKIREGEINNSPDAIILDKVNSILEDYTFACGQK